jgi:formylmethanofuran dehydrogenase subunit E
MFEQIKVKCDKCHEQNVEVRANLRHLFTFHQLQVGYYSPTLCNKCKDEFLEYYRDWINPNLAKEQLEWAKLRVAQLEAKLGVKA